MQQCGCDSLKKIVKQCDVIRDQLDDAKEHDDEVSTSINSNYYDINKFNKIKHDKKSAFNLLHVNIASLDAHIDDLKSLLSRLKSEIDIIGISEHKIKKDRKPLNNIVISGYDEFIFEPTGSTHGGADFYVKKWL